MKGLLYYDNGIYGIHTCNICGAEIKHYEAWVYKEGGVTLLFCGNKTKCRDEFLSLNKLQDIEDEG